MTFKTTTICFTQSAVKSPAWIKLFKTAAIPPINPAPTKAGIKGIKISAMVLSTLFQRLLEFLCCLFSVGCAGEDVVLCCFSIYSVTLSTTPGPNTICKRSSSMTPSTPLIDFNSV